MRILLLIGVVLLTACGESRPPSPTTEQSDQLNEAESMLDAEARNEKGPEANASGPSS